MVYGGTQGWDYLTSYSSSEGRKPVTDIGGALAYLYSSSNRWSLNQQAVRIAYKQSTLVIASVVVCLSPILHVLNSFQLYRIPVECNTGLGEPSGNFPPLRTSFTSFT